MIETHGSDCLDALKGLEESSIDSLVTDPPAGISFMGKEWDHHKGGRDQWVSWLTDVMKECHRVLKPGAHGLVWALPRTSHWTATALENAGFQIREKVLHIFGTGFPKSLNINKVLERDNLVCVCSKDMHNLQNGMDTENKVSSREKQNLQPKVCSRANATGSHSTAEGQTNLPDLQSDFPAEEQHCFVESKDLQQGVSRQAKASKRIGDKTKTDSASWQSGLDGSQQRILFKEHERPEESSMEGRRNLQEIEGQLHRPEICAMPQRVPANGSQGRLHHGASASDGQTCGQMSHENGSGSSQGPRHEEQSHNQPRILSQQHNAQNCRSCGKARIQPGLGTALKPAVEEWILIRKPLSEKTVAQNVLKHGTGGVNIDGCRVAHVSEKDRASATPQGRVIRNNFAPGQGVIGLETSRPDTSLGRFPSNLVLSHNDDCDDECSEGCAVSLLDGQSLAGGMHSAGSQTARTIKTSKHQGVEFLSSDGADRSITRFGDSGGASRFFYVAKASKSDRGTDNKHPTVKSTKLMEYLIKLVTPEGGTVLDPFMGSGSTGVAAKRLGFSFVGIEREPQYLEIANKRLAQ